MTGHDNCWDELIEAINIFKTQYPELSYPFYCEHDTLHVCIKPEKFSDEQIERLDELGFHLSEEHGDQHFISFKFGSC